MRNLVRYCCASSSLCRCSDNSKLVNLTTGDHRNKMKQVPPRVPQNAAVSHQGSMSTAMFLPLQMAGKPQWNRGHLYDHLFGYLLFLGKPIGCHVKLTWNRQRLEKSFFEVQCGFQGWAASRYCWGWSANLCLRLSRLGMQNLWWGYDDPLKTSSQLQSWPLTSTVYKS